MDGSGGDARVGACGVATGAVGDSAAELVGGVGEGAKGVAGDEGATAFAVAVFVWAGVALGIGSGLDPQGTRGSWPRPSRSAEPLVPAELAGRACTPVSTRIGAAEWGTTGAEGVTGDAGGSARTDAVDAGAAPGGVGFVRVGADDAGRGAEDLDDPRACRVGPIEVAVCTSTIDGFGDSGAAALFGVDFVRPAVRTTSTSTALAVGGVRGAIVAGDVTGKPSPRGEGAVMKIPADALSETAATAAGDAAASSGGGRVDADWRPWVNAAAPMTIGGEDVPEDAIAAATDLEVGFPATSETPLGAETAKVAARSANTDPPDASTAVFATTGALAGTRVDWCAIDAMAPRLGR